MCARRPRLYGPDHRLYARRPRLYGPDHRLYAGGPRLYGVDHCLYAGGTASVWLQSHPAAFQPHEDGFEPGGGALRPVRRKVL
jgi:hypothetical protein